MNATRWHYRRSLASRVALLATLAVGVSLAFVALGAYATVRMQLQSSLDESLLSRAEKVAEAGALSAITGTRFEVPSWALGAADVRIIFIDSSGGSRSADQGPTFRLGQEELEVAAGVRSQTVRTVVADGVHYRVVTVQAGPDQALVLAQSQEPQLNVLKKLGLVMTLFGAAGMIAAALAGWAVARNGLRPVRRLTADVERIARTEDLTPLRVEGADEVARLASAFNQMLAALAGSRDRQRRLVADAGHELRTPLTSLRTNLDLLTQADDTGGLPPRARAELLDDVRAQIEELTTLIGDLMELARDEPYTLVVDEVDLADVVDRALARVRRRAPDVEITARTSPWWVDGDAAALERAVANLLDNAVKWSPAGGTIGIALAGGQLVVDDAGPGIAAEDLPHVFERFYRSEESRAMPGSGLGLSIVRQVAERHSGTVSAGHSPLGGARLTMQIPGHPVPAAPRLSEDAATDRTRGAGDPPSTGSRRTLRSRSNAP